MNVHPSRRSQVSAKNEVRHRQNRNKDSRAARSRPPAERTGPQETGLDPYVGQYFKQLEGFMDDSAKASEEGHLIICFF